MQNPKPEVPPRANNYPIQNQNVFNNVPNARSPPPNARSPSPNARSPPPNVRSPPPNARSPPPNGQMFNNRPPLNPGQPVVAQRNASSPPNQVQQFPMQNMQRPAQMQSPQQNHPTVPQRNGINNPQFPSPVKQTPQVNNNSNLPQPRPNINQNQNLIRNQPTTLPISQLSSPMSPTNSNSNIQINANPNIQQRRNLSQKDLPPPPAPPAMPKKSNGSLGRSASSIKTKFVDIVNRSLSRKFNNKPDKSNRLSSYGGMNVHSAYRNSLMAKPVFDSKLLLKPQNPNFIFSLGSVFMIASVSLAIAFVALRNGGLSERNIHDISSEDSFGFIFFSIFMLLIGLTGYIAYHKKWTSLLITYSVFLVFGLIVQIIIILLFLNIYIHPLIQMRYKWIDAFSEGEKHDIQEDYGCCGYLSVVDHGSMSSQCMPDTGTTTLTVKSAAAMKNTFSYLDPNLVNGLSKRQVVDAGAGAAADNTAAAPAADNAAAGAANTANNAAAGAANANTNANANANANANTNANADANAAAAAAAAAAASGTGDPNGTENLSQTLKDLYKTKDPNTYTEADIQDEGCARIIVSAIRTGLLQYIIIEGVMALLFIVAFYFAVMHFKEQLKIEKEIDSARATFG